MKKNLIVLILFLIMLIATITIAMVSDEMILINNIIAIIAVITYATRYIVLTVKKEIKRQI